MGRKGSGWLGALESQTVFAVGQVKGVAVLFFPLSCVLYFFSPEFDFQQAHQRILLLESPCFACRWHVNELITVHFIQLWTDL